MVEFRGVSNKTNVHQLLDESGKASTAMHTNTLWVDTSETNVFAQPTSNNKISSFTTGIEYFKDLITICDSASDEILIAGWQVNWDALLMPELRLYDLLLRCAKRGVKIYVMPWDDHEPIQTYDDQTKIVLENINTQLPKNSKGRVTVTLCGSFASINKSYFSHHQKQVVVDRKYAYVGGIDLAYGRMDDATYDLRADANGRQSLNRYNPGIPPLQTLDEEDIVDPDKISGKLDSAHFRLPLTSRELIKSAASKQIEKIDKGKFQVRYGGPGIVDIAADTASVSSNKPLLLTLDPGRQPRMPWQDIHCKIEGPAVSDLLRNFIGRWNVVAENKLVAALSPASFAKAGNTDIQVLRSAPAAQCQKESSRTKSGTQKDIYSAMKSLIKNSRRFIYIENQFFVSDFGEIGGPTGNLSPAAHFINSGDGGFNSATLWFLKTRDAGDSEALPKNTILKTLLARLEKAIVDDIKRPKFHIYITLPVHPEGALIDSSITAQVYYTMQTLVFGSHSLINGIRRLIKARQLKDEKEVNYKRVINDPKNKEHETVDISDCYDYVTLLNLRNWIDIKGNYFTEQIYIHSKLMIVDDRFAIVGSANINDRSLLGERDSELAVLVKDNNSIRADINGKGSNQPVRIFAHELRMKVWSKIFGITGNIRPADLKLAIEQPGHPESWKKIQQQAKINAALYEDAFPYIPRNFSPFPKFRNRHASILPTWNPELKQKDGLPGGVGSPLPFQDEFWSRQQSTDKREYLKDIKGFITEVPIHWTEGENLRIKLPTAILVNNDIKNSEEKFGEEELFAKNNVTDNLKVESSS